jgi:hypothetical protein
MAGPRHDHELFCERLTTLTSSYRAGQRGALGRAAPAEELVWRRATALGELRALGVPMDGDARCRRMWEDALAEVVVWREAWDIVLPLLSEGKVKPHVDRTYPSRRPARQPAISLRTARSAMSCSRSIRHDSRVTLLGVATRMTTAS